MNLLQNPGSAVQGAGTGMAAYGSYQAGQTNAYIANQRAMVAGMQANSATQQGAGEEALYRTKANQFIGKQQAAVGASGIQSSGSPLRVMQDTAGLAASDIARIRNNAALEAWGFRATQTADMENAKNRATAGTMGAFGTLLTGSARNRGIWNDDAS